MIGCAIGWELAKRGAKPAVIDGNGEVGHGSTAASCGIVRRFYSTPTMTAMAYEGAGIWADWARHLGVGESDGLLARFERPGMLFIPPELDDGVERIVQHIRCGKARLSMASLDAVIAPSPGTPCSGWQTL